MQGGPLPAPARPVVPAARAVVGSRFRPAGRGGLGLGPRGGSQRSRGERLCGQGCSVTIAGSSSAWHWGTIGAHQPGRSTRAGRSVPWGRSRAGTRGDSSGLRQSSATQSQRRRSPAPNTVYPSPRSTDRAAARRPDLRAPSYDRDTPPSSAAVPPPPTASRPPPTPFPCVPTSGPPPDASSRSGPPAAPSASLPPRPSSRTSADLPP